MGVRETGRDVEGVEGYGDYLEGGRDGGVAKNGLSGCLCVCLDARRSLREHE